MIYGWRTSDPWDFSPGPSTIDLVRPLRHGWKIRVWSWSTQTWVEILQKNQTFRKAFARNPLYQVKCVEMIYCESVLYKLSWNHNHRNFHQFSVSDLHVMYSQRKNVKKIIYWHDFSFANLTSIAEVSSETFSQQCEVFSGCLLWLSIFSFEAMDVCFLKNMFLGWTGFAAWIQANILY